MSEPLNGVEVPGVPLTSTVNRWPVGSATGLGPMPGADIDETMRIVVGELPELPFLPQLPARGVGADRVGRTIAMLVDIWAEVVPSGWRITRRPSRDVRHGRDFLSWDIDALEVHTTAPRVKVAVCGPWTLGARVELVNGNRAITDAGAMHDITQSLAEGIAEHLGELRARMPQVEFILQLDEPDLDRVLAGWLPTASGFGTVNAVETITAIEHLDVVLSAGDARSRVLDAGPVWSAVASSLPLTAVVVDFSALGRTAAELDPLGEWLSSGRSLLGGVVPARPVAGAAAPLATQAAPLREPLAALGFSADVLARQLVPTPAGDLAVADQSWVGPALRRSRDIARLLADDADWPT